MIHIVHRLPPSCIPSPIFRLPSINCQNSPNPWEALCTRAVIALLFHPLAEHDQIILGKRLDPANFRRQVDTSDTLIPTERFRTGSHRPARLYRYNRDVELADRGPLPTRH